MEKVLRKVWSTTLKTVGPYNLDRSLKAYFAIRQLEGESVTDSYVDGVYRTTMRLPSTEVIGVCLKQCGQGLDVQFFASRSFGEQDRVWSRKRLEQCWTVSEDLRPFYRLAEKDQNLVPIFRTFTGAHSIVFPDPFQALVLAILLQNAPIKRTHDMERRLLEIFGEEVRFGDVKLKASLSPEKLASLDPRILKEQARLGYRAERVSALSSRVAEDKTLLSRLYEVPTSEARRLLCELPGIGPYSAEFILMVGLGRRDLLPIDIWSAPLLFRHFFAGRKLPSDQKALFGRVQRRAETLWGEWRGLVMYYLLSYQNAQKMKEGSDPRRSPAA